MFGRGKSSPHKRPAFVLWIVEKLSCWADRKQCPLFLPFTFPDLHGEDVDEFFFFFFFFCNPLMQFSVIVEITAGPLSGTTARGGSEEGPVLTSVEPWFLTPQWPHCAWLWDGGKDPVTLPLYGSEEQSLILLSAQCYQWDLFLLFFFSTMALIVLTKSLYPCKVLLAPTTCLLITQ